MVMLYNNLFRPLGYSTFNVQTKTFTCRTEETPVKNDIASYLVQLTEFEAFVWVPIIVDCVDFYLPDLGLIIQVDDKIDYYLGTDVLISSIQLQNNILKNNNYRYLRINASVWSQTRNKLEFLEQLIFNS